MFVQKIEMEKLAAIAVLAVLLLSGCFVLFSDMSSAEDEEEPSVEQTDSVTIVVDGENKEVDAFTYQGVIYAVTSDRESEEEAGVYGVVDEAQFDVYIVVCSFSYGEDDDEVNYSVTNVLSEFSSVTTGKPIILADTILDYGEGCFSGLPDSHGVLIVGDGVAPEDEDNWSDEEKEAQQAYDECLTKMGYENYKKIGDITPTEKFTVTFFKGKVTYPESKYKNQDTDEGSDMYMSPQTFVAGITTQINECSYENPYYDFDGWKDETETTVDPEVVAGDSASVTIYGGKIYIDAAVAYDDVSDKKFAAAWVEADYDEDKKNFGDYPLSYMYITSAIIIILFIVGFAMLGYRTYMARKA